MGNLQSSFDTDWPYEEHELKFPVVRDGSVTLKHFLEAIQISTSDLAEKYKWSTRGNLQCQVQETMWLPHQSDEREYKEFEKLKDTIAKFYAEDGESNKEKLQDAITKFMQAFPPKQRQIALRIRAYPLALDKYMTWDNFTEYTRQAKAWEEQEARKKHDLELRQTKGSRRRQVLKRNKGGGGGGQAPLSLAQLKEKKKREKQQKEDAERVRLLELEQEEKKYLASMREKYGSDRKSVQNAYDRVTASFQFHTPELSFNKQKQKQIDEHNDKIQAEAQKIQEYLKTFE